MTELWRALQNLCKFAKQTLVPDDSGDYQKVQMKFLGQTQTVRQVTPYGLYSSSPINSEWLILSLRANPDDKVGIANDYPNRFKAGREKGLEAGEVALYNILTGSYIFLDSSKNINMVGKNDLNITIDANQNISIGANSTVTIAGDESQTIEGNRTIAVKGNEEETIDGTEARTIKDTSTVEVQGASTQNYKDTLDVNVDGDETRINLMSVTESVLLNKSETVIGTKTIAIPTTNHTGNINLTGNYNITGELTVNGIAFSSHIHTDVQAGSDDSGPPDNPTP